MYGYIYMTTNLINGKRYIGMHRSSEFTKNYLGSGKILRQAVSKYGFDKFKVEMIDQADTLEELSNKEAHWIDYYDAVNSSEFYNIKQGGFGGYKINGVSIKKGVKISDKARLNTSIAHKGYKYSESRKLECSKRMLGSNNPFYGKTFTQDTLDHLSKVRKGRYWVNNGEVETTIYPEKLDEYLAKGYTRGRLFARGKHI